MKINLLPKGWTLDEILELASKYDEMSNDELALELELAHSSDNE